MQEHACQQAMHRSSEAGAKKTRTRADEGQENDDELTLRCWLVTNPRADHSRVSVRTRIGRAEVQPADGAQ